MECSGVTDKQMGMACSLGRISNCAQLRWRPLVANCCRGHATPPPASFKAVVVAAAPHAVCSAPVVANDEVGLAAHLSQDLLRGGTDEEDDQHTMVGWQAVTVQHMCTMRYESRRAGSDSMAVHAAAHACGSPLAPVTPFCCCPACQDPSPHLGCVNGESLQVGPQVEAGHPLVQHTPAGPGGWFEADQGSSSWQA